MLDSFVKQEDLLIKVSCKDWEEAVDVSARPLLKNGVIDQHYVDTIKVHHVEMGPYMVIAPKVALMHTRPEDGAHAVGLSIMTLAEPVAFGNEDNDPVELVLTFATPDSESHLKLLADLMDFLMEEDTLERLLAATSQEEAYQVLK